jgi:SAM-dependent methyltransferase
MAESLYAQPRVVTDPASCLFYHTMELPELGVISGQWDLRGRLDDYLGGIPLKGRRVLDVGTASGFLSFAMEERGACVVSFDADTADRIAFLPFRKSLYSVNRPEWARATNAYLDTLRNSYWLAHRLYQSRCKAFYGDIYELPEALGSFDVVVIGQILVHLKDPVNAIASAARRCSDTLVIVEGMIDSEDRFAKFFARADGGPEWIWWQYSTGLYRELMAIIGFEVIALTEHSYTCHHEYTHGAIPVKTLVARRKPD